MISFETDYIEGAHFNILKRLIETDLDQESGYGHDRFTAEAKSKILAAIGSEDADIEFFDGGTQANLAVIDTMLKPYEGVIAAKTGHISIHEAGAIEATGHKVLELPEHDGKLDPVEVLHYIADFYADGNHSFGVFPGMIYISHPTEYGTLYSKKELQALRLVCDKYKIPLYMDGARLSYGLAAKGTDVTLKDIAGLCDVFYIGGTKVGALIGEAVVFMRGCIPDNFETRKKRRGALLAKGRLLGIQFAELFTNDLYLKLGEHAIEMADLMKSIFEEKGYEFFRKSPTNQQYIVLENEKMKDLSEKVKFSFWEKVDENRTAVRFCTSWATKKENVEVLRELL